MAIALITAGGNGTRTGNSVPKQFLTVHDIPVIVYTMKNVQNSGCYDDLYVICADGWKDFVASYALQYDISIFRGAIPCGNSRFSSISNGIEYLSKMHNSEVIVSLIDANRPLTAASVFRKSIDTLNKADLVLPLEPCYDTMYIAECESKKVLKSIDRKILYKGQSPETIKLGTATEIHNLAKTDGLHNMTTTEAMLHYGKIVAYIDGGSSNFKITTADDLTIFKALVKPL